MHEPFLNFLQLYRHIPTEDEAKIAGALVYKEIKVGEVLLEPGTIPQRLYFILEGVLKISLPNEKGSMVTHYFIKENQFCTILKNFTEGTVAQETIIAATNARVVYFEKASLKALYNELAYFKELIGGIMQEMLLNKIDIRTTYLGQDAAERYHKFITTQSDIALRVPLSDVASYLGITQQSLSRIRKDKG
jgi:CRP/FNR family transcriptional regulator, anaerobic regulatory protein